MAKLETITASELTNLVVHKTGRTRAEVKYVIDSIVEEVGECIAEGYNVSLFGLVKLSLKHSPAKPRRKGRNPRTGEEVMVKAKPESLKVRATVLKAVKDRLPSTRTAAGKDIIKALTK